MEESTAVSVPGLTLDQLSDALKSLEAQREEAYAKINMLAGAVEVTQKLIELAKNPPPKADEDAAPSAKPKPEAVNYKP